MTHLYPLLVALLLYLGPSVQVHNVDAWRLAPNSFALGATYCLGGQSLVRFYRIPEFLEYFRDEVVVHEYLHAAACKADGVLGHAPSSLDPTMCATLPDDCAHSWTTWALTHPDTAATILSARTP